MGMTAETEALLIRVYASGMMSGIVTRRLNESPGADVPTAEQLDTLQREARAVVVRIISDPLLRQQILDVIEDEESAGVVMRLCGEDR